MTVPVAAFGFLVAWSAAFTPADEAGMPRSLAELTEQYRSGDRDEAVAAVALWTQQDVEEGAQDLLQVAEATSRQHSSPDEVARSEAMLVGRPRS